MAVQQCRWWASAPGAARQLLDYIFNFPGCFKEVSKLYQRYFKKWSVSMMFQGYFKAISRKSQNFLNDIWGSFKFVSRLFKECFMSVSRKLSGLVMGFKCVSKVFEKNIQKYFQQIWSLFPESIMGMSSYPSTCFFMRSISCIHKAQPSWKMLIWAWDRAAPACLIICQ